MALPFVEFFFLQTIFFGAYACLQVKSFSDFLEYNHLKYGIIILCNDDGLLPMEDIKEISKKPFWLSYYHVDQMHNDINMAAFKDLFYNGGRKLGVSLNIRCQSGISDILRSASASNFFNSSQAWFILTQSLVAGKEALVDLETNIDADITLGIKMENKDSLVLYDLYKVCHRCGMGFQSTEKGSWSDSGGMQVLPYFWQTTVQRRRNFSQITLGGGVVVAAIPEGLTISEHLEGYKNMHLDTMQRKSYHLLIILSEIYNFRFDVVVSPLWGHLKDDNWTGVMGNLLNGNIEIALTPLRFTFSRIRAVRYLAVTHDEVIRFLFRHPRQATIRNKFLEPFTSTVWCTVLGVILAGVCVMAITMHHECGKGCSDGAENKLDFFTLVILEAIFLQGPSQMFQFVSTRTLIITICIFAVMLNQFYSAFIVGSLLADVPRTIVNLPALFNSSLEVGMENVILHYELFINTSNQMAKDIYVHRIMRNPQRNILPLEKGVERIGRGGYAYHVALIRAYRMLKEQLTQPEFCDLQEVEMERPFKCSPAVPNGSSFKEHFATAILQLRETGLMAYHEKFWSIEKPQCSADMIEKDTTVDMEHFIPAMGFLAVAMLTSCFILGVEHFVNSMAVKKPEKKKFPKPTIKKQRLF